MGHLIKSRPWVCVLSLPSQLSGLCSGSWASASCSPLTPTRGVGGNKMDSCAKQLCSPCCQVVASLDTISHGRHTLLQTVENVGTDATCSAAQRPTLKMIQPSAAGNLVGRCNEKKSSVRRKLWSNKFASKASKAEVSVDKEQKNENDVIQDEGLKMKGDPSSQYWKELADEEEENFPSVLSHRDKFFEEEMLVWCKWQWNLQWPAVVKAVKRKHRRARVLFIDGTTNEKKKVFSVFLKSLKHFDCEELIEQAQENYFREIEWCFQLESFLGYQIQYFAADISYPVRKEGYQSVVQMTFPNTGEEGPGQSSSDTSLQKPLRKLLPDGTRAARDKEKLVDFIVKTKGAEEHLLGILKTGKQSCGLKKILNSKQYMTCVETYLEDEEQLDLVNLHQTLKDGIRFVSDVLLPEAIICAIAAVGDIDYEKAEKKYMKGPLVSKRERDLFDEQVLGKRNSDSQWVGAGT
uniref:Uncharacterized protein n=1 Tax=Geospiza parvula TaxID=87175 RepID=A0A8C3NC47_GEOPR